MATLIGLPKLSPTMEEGVLAKWNKKEGDKVSPGDVIAEVETDKANMDFVLEDEGTLLKQLVKEGDTVKLGAPVAILGQPGEDISGLLRQPTGDSRQPTAGKEPAAAPAKEPAAARPAPAPAKEPPAPRPSPAPAPAPRSGNGQQAATGKILASPLAKTLAAEKGVDLRLVRGTGPGGRIVERDVHGFLEGAGGETSAVAPAATGEPASSPAPPSPTRLVETGGDAFVDRPLSPMRKTIARRLVEAKATIPHFYLTADCDVGPLLDFRAALNAVTGEDGKLSVNDLLIKAVALAFRRVPQANASFLGDRIRYHGRVHVGVAVAIEDGLVTPVVFDADRKGLAAIAAEIRDLAERARARKLRPEEMTGSTISLSNLGMFGVEHFEAILNPPEACIVAVGAARKQPVVVGDELTIGHRMALTMSCDHRAVDGALGARALAELVKLVEHPAALAL
jgi:pyruvate dehydrogenase E2 component (dihydrolipoamide acetyltransferase)